jgi:CRP/FNR family cyclic AMP-dependent transcriptional regulator
MLKPTEALKNIPLFACLEAADLEELARAAVAKAYPKNAFLFSQGDLTDSLYVICSGKVKAVIIDEHGKEVILRMFGPGDYFGEIAMIDGRQRSASIVTREAIQVLVLSRSALCGILVRNPDFAINLLKGMVRRLRDSDKQIESLALMDVYGRVARLLTHLARPQRGQLVVPERLTHQEIASLTGASREMVSRIIKGLIRSGHIRVRNRLITILHPLPISW